MCEICFEYMREKTLLLRTVELIKQLLERKSKFLNLMSDLYNIRKFLLNYTRYYQMQIPLLLIALDCKVIFLNLKHVQCLAYLLNSYV